MKNNFIILVKNKKIFTLFIKIIIITLFLFLKINKNKNKTLKYYFSYYICKFFIFKENFNCTNQIFKNKNFYDNIKEKNKSINYIINIKKTKIENILILVGIVPFLKNKSYILYKINNKEMYNIFKKIFIDKKIKNRFIKLNEYDFHYFIENFNDLVNYKWKLIPDKNIIDNIRYILNNYYNEFCKELFYKSLNLNFKNFIHNKKDILSFKAMEKLMSKLFYL